MWKHLLKMKQSYYLVLAYALSITIAILVYATGGTHNSIVNFMNIPILIASSTNRKSKGVIHAGISGLIVGPFMPLFTTTGTPQKPLYWVIRMVYFLILSFVVGTFADYYKKEFEKNSRIEKEISESHLATIYALAKLSESRDDETGTHIERVSELCKILTEKLSHHPKYSGYINSNYIDNIYIASTLHDIGKVGIPDSILLKPGRLTPGEFEVIKKHTTIGSGILAKVQEKYPSNTFLSLGYNIVYYHHENWDGSGYPTGKSKEDIPLSARIMVVVDVYDSLRSKRVYKEAYSHETSLDIILQGKGTHFDPDIVDVFMENEALIRDTYDRITERVKFKSSI
ncbi:MAG TPA: hypothetical protein DEG06_02000 [Lachnospiraceae bacterium]|jgi:HD-GYP domain-containing protein (c-di-GMP phosphodiesterase class II)|nr:hypothetical protein [Lachnospiraceae bacterium]HBY70990.1 hypothetical protein [Lachnospiraceae bacterium]HCM13738.1 hypothetical protein [Lachnospiraceae bacterium]HCR39818.1 hypothetical protein [Lachnospiraceae bacterium]